MRYRFSGVEDESTVVHRLVARLQVDRVAAIVGPHGTGKTTLLQRLIDPLHSHFAAVQMVRLSSDARPQGLRTLDHWIRSALTFDTTQLTTYERDQTLSTCDAKPSPVAGACGERLLVIDGFEQLAVLGRACLMLRIKLAAITSPIHLLITAHRDLWGIPTVYRTRWDDQIVKALTAEKLSPLPSGLRAEMSLVAARLAAEEHGTGQPERCHGGNVRDYWFSLYDAYETLRAKQACTNSSE